MKKSVINVRKKVWNSLLNVEKVLESVLKVKEDFNILKSM